LPGKVVRMTELDKKTKERWVTTDMDLKQLERKAWRSSFQDGLLDIYLGLLLILLSIPALLPGIFTSELREYAGYVGFALVALLFYWWAKRYVSAPRMGRARFGRARKARQTRATVVYGVSAVGGVIVLLLALAWRSGASGGGSPWLGARELFAFGIGFWMVLVFGLGSYFTDFDRGYLVGALYALAFGGTILMDEPALFAFCGAILVLVGLVVFGRFLRAFPKPAELESTTSHGGAKGGIDRSQGVNDV
jgi:hypothetical protein